MGHDPPSVRFNEQAAAPPTDLRIEDLLASRGRRFAALLIDMAIVSILLVVGALLLVELAYLGGDSDGTTALAFALLVLLWLSAALGYAPLLLSEVQDIDIEGGLGADQITVNDLTGTPVTNVLVNLSSSLGSGDGQADTVIVNGTGGNDHITLTGSTNQVNVLGLAATVTVVGGEWVEGAAAPIDGVVAAAAHQKVDPTRALQIVIPVAAQDDVGAAAPRVSVVAGSGQTER